GAGPRAGAMRPRSGTWGIILARGVAGSSDSWLQARRPSPESAARVIRQGPGHNPARVESVGQTSAASWIAGRGRSCRHTAEPPVTFLRPSPLAHRPRGPFMRLATPLLAAFLLLPALAHAQAPAAPGKVTSVKGRLVDPTTNQGVPSALVKLTNFADT